MLADYEGNPIEILLEGDTMLKTIFRWFVIAVVVVALWKLFDGDLGRAISTVADVVIGWVNSLSDWLSTQPVIRDIIGG